MPLLVMDTGAGDPAILLAGEGSSGFSRVAVAVIHRESRLRGWSDVELGRRSGFRQTKISRLLRGEQAMSADDLGAMLGALEWDLRRLADAIDDYLGRERPVADPPRRVARPERVAQARRRLPFLPEALAQRLAMVEQEADALLVERDEIERLIELHRREALERAAGRLDEVAEGGKPEG